MKKRVIVTIIMGALVLALLVGCGSSNSTSSVSEGTTEKYYADKDFLKDLAAGLEKRWSFDSEKEEENAEYYQKRINAETDILSKYKTMEFEDDDLQILALSYLKSLEGQNEASKLWGSDSFYDKWDAAYNERTKILSEIANKYDIPVDEKNKAYLDELLSNGGEVEKKENKVKQANELLKDIKFEKVEDEDGFCTYEAVVENTTDINFVDYSFDASLLDKDGVQVETQYCNADNWKSGKKVKFTFSTDVKFKKTELTLNSWTDDQGDDYYQ